MQTLRAGCSKAGSKSFALPLTPFPGARNGQNLISWRRSLLSPTDPVWWRSMHAISSYRSNRATNKHINRQGQLQYTPPQLSAQCNNNSTVGCILCQCQWSHKNVTVIQMTGKKYHVLWGITRPQLTLTLTWSKNLMFSSTTHSHLSIKLCETDQVVLA